MDKFIIKKVSTSVNTSTDGSTDLPLPSSSTINDKTVKRRKYKDNYLNFGFTFIGDDNNQIPQCIVCGVTLSNESMVPNKLKRHLDQNHSHISKKSSDYFTRLLSSQKKNSTFMEKRLKISDKSLLCSFKISELIAKKKKPHTIGEELILPACKEIVDVMFGKEAAEQISNIPLSNDTVRRRIITMSEDIVKNVNEILQKDKEFALQLDESTDVSGKSQLISFIRFVNEEKIIEQFLFCRELQTTTTGVDIFNAVDNYFEENNMVWSNCISICTDGAAAMTGRFKGFLTLAKNKKPNLITIHCFLHREALMVKSSDGGELSDVLKTVIEMINYIKKRPVKCRIFEELCKNMGTEHTTLLYHTEIRWLSRGKILNRVLELQDQLQIFFEAENINNYANKIDDQMWCAKLAYLADIFQKLNVLNSSMQGRKENIISTSDKMESFKKKINLWLSCIKNDDFSCFSSVEESKIHLSINQKNGIKKYNV